MMFIMHGKLTANREDLSAEKAESNRGGGAGVDDPAIPPRRLSWPVQGFCGGWWG